VNESSIERLLAAVDALDVEAVVALFAEEARVLAADGRRAEGAEEVRELVTPALASLRSTSYEIMGQWQVDDVWIAEVDASYELRDFYGVDAVPLAFIMRSGPEGIVDARFYRAHERPVSEHDAGEQWGRLVRGHWIPLL